ncbi:MAG TPA: ABC transporter ATP-binding protein [Thermodesulfovibrionales bacterium]|nr:ABC transporter ATP-binding protein [Thermodesulfovibrionales bacterium]
MAEKPLIETEKVTKRFGSLTAVDGVTFSVCEGEAVGIIGPNGAGKTTFFNLLTGLFPPTEGRIRLSGNDITNTPPYKRVMLGIVRTFQLVSVFDSLRAIDNLVLSHVRFNPDYNRGTSFFFRNFRQEEILGPCREALKTMGIACEAEIMTSELSYGDKRKLEIAIALSLNPKILLLDEPFAGLSDVEIVEVLDLIGKVKEALTLIIIEHKISRIVDLVGRLSVMHEGRLLAEGTPREVLCNPAVREVYWGKEEGLACSV